MWFTNERVARELCHVLCQYRTAEEISRIQPERLIM